MRLVLLGSCAAAALVAVLGVSKTAAEDAAKVLTLTAKSANLPEAGAPIRVEILRWSTDAEREALIAAWNLKPIAPAGRGAGGGRAGKGKGAPVETSAPATPEGALARALQERATVGYLWSSEVSGYALKYAGKSAAPDGSERVVLITQKRLGAMNQVWKPTFTGEPNSYEFSVIELRLAKGAGVGKASLVGKVVADAPGQVVKIENFDALPVVFSDVHAVAGAK